MITSGLLDRLLLWQKFVIVGVVALFAISIPVVFYIREADKNWDAALLEREGLVPMASILRTIQLTQQHRGLSALVLGGVESEKDKRLAKQKEADAAYEALDAIIQSLKDKGVAEAWSQPKQDWAALRANVSGATLSVPQSYQAHTALVPKLLVVNDLMGDHFGLSLDPDADNYQLIQAMFYIQPYVTEELGKMRAKGAGLLAKKEATLEDKLVMAELIARAADRLGQMRTAYGKAVASNPDIGKRLGTGMTEALAIATQAMAVASEQIVKADTLTHSGVEYVGLTTRAIDAQFALNAAANKDLERSLGQKIADLRTLRATMLGSLALLLLMAVWLLRSILRSISVPMAEAVQVAQRIAKGDLTATFGAIHADEIGQLMAALRDMNDNLARMVGSVRQGIEEIDDGASAIASGNSDLSARTESQASSLEQTAAAMVEMTATVRQNADNARQANQLVNSTAEVAVRGGEIVAQVVSTMGGINESSRRIVDIIGVIDGIAFQTNILALNAAVEAARAGEQGRGFAVVASEVRSLAQRSAEAAREIKTLIGTSVEKVEAGNQLVGSAGKSMDEIVGSVKRVTSIMGEIVGATDEQRLGIEQIEQAVAQMDGMTQKNAALVEQAADAAAAMKDQSHSLVQAMASFRLP
ncbi:MAG: methyl-accepting chemotaxis protein [Pseudomonadota bacterium]